MSLLVSAEPGREAGTGAEASLRSLMSAAIAASTASRPSRAALLLPRSSISVCHKTIAHPIYFSFLSFFFFYQEGQEANNKKKGGGCYV
jgi:hypothetical protein